MDIENFAAHEGNFYLRRADAAIVYTPTINRSMNPTRSHAPHPAVLLAAMPEKLNGRLVKTQTISPIRAAARSIMPGERKVGKLRVKKRTRVPLNDYGRLFDACRPLSARVVVTRRSAPQFTSGQRPCLKASLF
jgi:hypothetical protein